jgi:hypothetical protein
MNRAISKNRPIFFLRYAGKGEKAFYSSNQDSEKIA